MMVANDGQAIKELVAIKKLLVLALVNSALTQVQIATAHNIDRTNVSRMFPKGALSNLKMKGNAGD